MASQTRNPEPAYPAKDAAILNGDVDLHSRIAATGEVDGARTQILELEVPIRSGRAWIVPKGHICRLATPKGPQVGDLNIWSLSNPRERFWAARTRQLHASHVTVGDRLWSNLPYLRPLVTIVGDSLQGYGVDEFGGRCHDLLGTRCDPYVNKLLSGDDFDYNCHSNLVRAVLPFGLTEYDVHDVLNVFQVTGLNKDGKYFMSPSPSDPNSYFDFFAETDVLCALSACPGGDLSIHGWGKDHAKRMLETCRPLSVKVYKITDENIVLEGWKEPLPAPYIGMHGLKAASFQDK